MRICIIGQCKKLHVNPKNNNSYHKKNIVKNIRKDEHREYIRLKSKI